MQGKSTAQSKSHDQFQQNLNFDGLTCSCNFTLAGTEIKDQKILNNVLDPDSKVYDEDCEDEHEEKQFDKN
eukprot:CAMPEP_0202960994 /NCGR_PEP_ID=MMETSP1396-20130829/5102_1 /ASSEMBLY_ACC=CAM_ASM_000872 /TAXON_ID= /ORGANISM="Pseudokeronopsis sp., Strain Brazil" /LENGTH=70 /DNA_ID=CAMNT_0049680541 /DNA_START=269 /DNA_END=481 /DNA_ORIENTATION=+